MDRHGRLGKKDWLRAARLALLKGGPSAVRVEKLARELRVSKGSFYWHFKNRKALMEALLREWQEEKSTLFGSLARGDLRQALTGFFEELKRRVVLSERGEWPSDAAIFAWAAVSPKVARLANREEESRIHLLKQMCGQNELAEYVYMAYLGFLVRRRRVPKAAEKYPILAGISQTLLLKQPAGLRFLTKSVRREEKL